MNVKELLKVTGLPIIVASLCCLSPVILVLFGLSSVAFAASLSATLYGQYKWAFRMAGLVLLAISLILHFRRSKGICTIDQAKKRRNDIINTIVLSLIIGVVGYVIWLYVIVELIGRWLKIW